MALAVPVGVHAQADLSDDYLNPTPFELTEEFFLTLTDGIFAIENTVQFSGADEPTADVDFFTLTVDPGLQIDRIEISRYDGSAVSFFGFGAGLTLAGDPSSGPLGQQEFAAGALGYALVGNPLVGNNLLDNLADGDVTIDRNGPLTLQLAMNRRFDPDQPLGAGTYAFVFQETGSVKITYELSFYASAVPEPNAMLLLVLGAVVGLAWQPRRRLVDVKPYHFRENSCFQATT
ncbi:MAG: PEP-CTERM sorting domain-containing protein [Planctomycetota bacterium]